jgi:hypothetical protein
LPDTKALSHGGKNGGVEQKEESFEVKHHASKQATPLNIQTAITPRDEIVSASPAESAVTFEELHAIYSRRLFRTIVRITKSPEDAEDALQDTLLRAHLALGTFEGRSSIYSCAIHSKDLTE